MRDLSLLWVPGCGPSYSSVHLKAQRGPHCCFVSKPLDLYLASCVRDISSKNATDDRGFCVVYTKDEGGLLRLQWNGHMHRGMEAVYSVYGTLHCGMFPLILLFFFFFFTTNFGSTVIGIMQLPLFYCGSFGWPCPFRVVNIPPPPSPVLRSSSLTPSGGLRHKQGRKWTSDNLGNTFVLLRGRRGFSVWANRMINNSGLFITRCIFDDPCGKKKQKTKTKLSRSIEKCDTV